MSGWNLPPGCSMMDIDRTGGDAGLCEVCHGAVDAGECSCDECPVCGAQGDPACYGVGKCGGMKRELVKDHGPDCAVCHPPMGHCATHGQYLLSDGCVACEAAAYEAAYTEEMECPIEARPPTDAELALADFQYDCYREARRFG